MTPELIAFWAFFTVTVLAAVGVISLKNPVHAVLSLVLTFFTTACLWLLLQAEFLGITLILVYVGAVMVLFLFVVMMLDINIESVRRGFWNYLPLGLLVGTILVVEMAAVLSQRYFSLESLPNIPAAAGYSNTKELGRLLYTDYAYPFELASVILLVGIAAAAALTLRGKRKSKSVTKNFTVSRLR